MSQAGVPVKTRREYAIDGIRLAAPASLFIAVYLALFLAAGYAAVPFSARSTYWIALASAALATFVTVRIVEHGEWNVGFFVAPRFILRESVFGVAFAAAVIGASDLLIVGATGLRHVRGSGFPWWELVIVFLPAAVHEEVVFRGYLFQRIRAWNRPAAIVATSVAFSALHAGNGGVTAIAFVNLALAGVLLSFAYERYQRLWFPIGIHFTWNVLSGPVLGYDVSGYTAAATLLRTVGRGPDWATGGAFGIEASAWMIPIELAAIAFLARPRRAGDPAFDGQP